MTKYLTLPFKVSDARNLDIVAGSTLKLFEGKKHSYTMLSEDLGVAFCCGIYDYWPGLGEAWLVMPKDKRKFPNILKTCRDMITEREKEYFRIQCFIAADKTINRNWLEHMGFVFETYVESWYNKGEKTALYIWGNLCLPQ